jgi:hypothetical protein
MAEGLPLNRKEKYYTGTVFPGIVCADDFRHFDVFAHLLPGSPSFDIDARPASTNIQFFTEYSPLHSFVGGAKARMLEIPASNETPDVAIIVDGHSLIVLEAKMFQPTTAASLNQQLRAQEPFIRCVKASMGVTEVHHAALIPKAMADSIGSLEYPTVTWDSLLQSFSQVVPDNYFLGVLGIALQHEPPRVSGWSGVGKNADARLLGSEIYDAHKRGELRYKTMGRGSDRRGLETTLLNTDIRSGKWRSTRYEVRFDPVPLNGNWFEISRFVERVDSMVAVGGA